MTYSEVHMTAAASALMARCPCGDHATGKMHLGVRTPPLHETGCRKAAWLGDPMQGRWLIAEACPEEHPGP